MTFRYAVGIDFGTESARAVVVDVADGRLLSSALYEYSHGVIDERLPESGVELAPAWALQDPDDYVRAVQTTVPAALSEAGVSPSDVIGIGIDFTACTMLPTLADGTPLSRLPEFRANPHAWVKLWKHHAAQPEADEVNRVARERGEGFLSRYGGKISSEWLFPKILQILREAPEVYAAADRMIEATDWVIWQLTGAEVRNECAAGYKAIWEKSSGYPSPDYFSALDPRLADVVDQKLSLEFRPLGARAGSLTEQAAAWTGLLPGTPVAVANLDAHVSLPACGVREPGRMVMIMGTSICHLVLGTEVRNVEGMCGAVEDGIIPGFWGFEAGQSCVGDGFAWFVENCVPEAYENEARRRRLTIHELLEQKAAALRPGESGLLALDWLNGNRSILVDVDLTGLLVGLTIATRPEEIYRTLIESTAFGTRTIIETFVTSGVPITELIACGGLPERNRLLMQIYADVTGLPISVAAASQTPALGAAMHGAVAAGEEGGGYGSILEAAARMGHLRPDVYEPNAEAKAVYDRLYADYTTLHDYFGRGGNDVMKRLGALRAETKARAGRPESRDTAEGEEVEAAARDD